MTTPSDTFAILVELDFQLYFACAVSGLSIGVSVSVSPMPSFTVPLLSSVTFVGFSGSITRIFALAVFLLAVVAVMVTVPSPTAVTFPRRSTVATALLEDFQLMVE